MLCTSILAQGTPEQQNPSESRPKQLEDHAAHKNNTFNAPHLFMRQYHHIHILNYASHWIFIKKLIYPVCVELSSLRKNKSVKPINCVN